MMGMLVAWSQVFTFPAREVAHLSVVWSVGKITVEHREDTFFRVEIRKPDTLTGRVVLGGDTVAYVVRLEKDTLRVHMLGAEKGYRRKTGALEGLRLLFSLLGMDFGEQPRQGGDDVQVVITGPARPYGLILRIGEATLRTPASGQATVNIGDLAVTGGDTTRLTVKVNIGDVRAKRIQKLSANLNIGEVDLEEIREADVSLNIGDLTATRVQNLSFSVNLGDIQVHNGRRVRGSVNMGSVKVVGVPAESVQVNADRGKVHIQEAQP